jgi:hypothetical protein
MFHFTIPSTVGIKFDFQQFINSETNQNMKKNLLVVGSILKDVRPDDPRRKVTLILNEFLKGITWFQSEVTFNDHRRGSCSQKGTTNFNCVGITDRATKKSNKRVIEKCYIERLIYDNLWQHTTTSQQDEGHLKWLKETKDAYNTCFPDHSIEIEVKYNQDGVILNSYFNSLAKNTNIPITLIIRKFEDQKQIDEEIYTKYYDNVQNEYMFPVMGIRVKNNRQYYKNTHFLKNKIWLLHKKDTRLNKCSLSVI